MKTLTNSRDLAKPASENPPPHPKNNGGNSKAIVNLNSSFEKAADSQ
jgi:hypothetical protein